MSSIPLPLNPARVAVETLAAYDYQIWTSIEFWLRLRDDEVIFLEGAEDLDVVEADGVSTVQVKRTAGTISLNVAAAHDAIKNFWATLERAPERVVRYVYLTTSTIAMEQNAAFDGLQGIVAWEKAAHDPRIAELIRAYLAQHLGAEGTFLEFLKVASVEELQTKLLSRLTWLTDQPRVDVVKASVMRRLEFWCDGEGLARQAAGKLRDALLARCWERVLHRDIAQRVLDTRLLATARDEATSFVLKLPLGTAQGLLQVVAQLPALQRQLSPLAILQQPIPPLPAQVVERPELIETLQTHLNRREPVFLSGSAFKGKTTLAMMVAHRVTMAARWIDLSGRDPGANRDVFDLMSMTLDGLDSAALLVFDDLDTSASSRKVYAASLRQMLHRAELAGKAVLITAQGQSESLSAEVASDWGLVMLDVPPLTAQEAQTLCLNLGCPSGSLATTYGTLVAAQTAGQPRLVQVRVQELAAQGWPVVSVDTFLGASSAVRTARQAARELFEGSVTAAEAQFIYEAGEFLHPPTRRMLLRLAELPVALAGASSVLDRLSGRWIDVAADGRMKVTPILKAELDVTWTEDRQRAVQERLFDAIFSSGPFSPGDASAMLFHAFFSRNGDRVVRAASIITHAKGPAAEQVHAHLGWMVHIGTEGGMRMPAIGPAYAAFRAIQLRVAVQENMDAVPAVVAAWRRDIEADADSVNGRSQSRLMLTMSILAIQAPFSIGIVLDAAADLTLEEANLDERIWGLLKDTTERLGEHGLPQGASIVQVLLASHVTSVRSLQDLETFLAWISRQQNSKLLADVDGVVGCSLARDLGSFVHWAWANEAKTSDPDWLKWIAVLDQGMVTVGRKQMSVLGRELGRAKSIILSEYQGDFSGAHACLDAAEAMFGASAVLCEQRVNLHYRADDFVGADEAWRALVQTFGKTSIEDPFAFRRAAICAARIGDAARSADIFEEASRMTDRALPLPTLLGLLGDGAYCAWQAGDKRRASRMLTSVALKLHESSGGQPDLDLQHTVVDLNRIARLLLLDGLESSDTPPIPYDIGQASSPQRRSDQEAPNPSSAARLFEAQVGILEARWGDASLLLMSRVKDLAKGNDPLAQLTASQALLARGMLESFQAEFLVGVAAAGDAYEALAAMRGAPRVDHDPVRLALLTLGLCSASNPAEMLSAWEIEIQGQSDAFMRDFIVGVRAGLAADPGQIREIFFERAAVSTPERVGALLSLLHHRYGDAAAVARAQGQLVVLVAIAFLTIHFESLISPLVERWAAQWEWQLAMAPQFRSSNAHAAELHDLLRRARLGRVTLAELVARTGKLVGVDQRSAVQLLRDLRPLVATSSTTRTAGA